MATTKYETAFTRYTLAMNQEAEKRSAAETRAIRRATFWMMIFTAVIAVATVAGILRTPPVPVAPPVLVAPPVPPDPAALALPSTPAAVGD